MAAGLRSPPYTKDILRLAAGQEHHGTLDAPDAHVSRRSRTCGSAILLDIALGGGAVTDIAVQVEACAYGQAAATLMTRHARGKSQADVVRTLAGLQAWFDGRGDAPDAWPELDRLEPVRDRAGRHGAVLLPFEALAQALREAGNGS